MKRDLTPQACYRSGSRPSSRFIAPSIGQRSPIGFSLIELMVAIAIFMIVGGAAVALVRKHVPTFTQQQGQSNLNLSLRNAAAQMQIDLVNAGTGYYPADDIPAWDIGVTIVNRNGGGCFDAATKSYTANCFDTLNVIAFDTSISAARPTANCTAAPPQVLDTENQSTLTIVPADATSTPAQLAAALPAGSELLIVKNDGSQLTTVDVIGDATSAGGVVSVPIEKTTTQTVNVNGANITFHGINAQDSLGISNNVGSIAGVVEDTSVPAGVTTTLGNQFCSSDWVLKLAPITYGVDATDPSNPKLYRQVGGAAGKRDIIAEQVIGFKVGASVRNPPAGCGYSFDSSNLTPCGYNGDWASITSVKLSLVGRTAPLSDVTNVFRNSFDGGSYKIEGVSLVVNPRNLTMKDN